MQRRSLLGFGVPGSNSDITAGAGSDATDWLVKMPRVYLDCSSWRRAIYSSFHQLVATSPHHGDNKLITYQLLFSSSVRQRKKKKNPLIIFMSDLSPSFSESLQISLFFMTQEKREVINTFMNWCRRVSHCFASPLFPSYPISSNALSGHQCFSRGG